MRQLIIPILFLAIACGQASRDKTTSTDTTAKNDSKEKDTNLKADQPTIGPGISEANTVLSGFDNSRWHVITDQETGWMKDVIDYFVIPERKKNADYPFVAKGDFDCDGKQDLAALVTDSSHKIFKLAFLLDDRKKIEWWKEDVQGAAISTFIGNEVAGFEDLEKEKKVKLKCAAVDLVWYEKSSYVVYWNGKRFDNIWTGD